MYSKCDVFRKTKTSYSLEQRVHMQVDIFVVACVIPIVDSLLSTFIVVLFHFYFLHLMW